jgi:hypothetical protein
VKNRHSKYLQSAAICTASVLLTLTHVCIAQTESAGSSEIDVVALQKKVKEAGKASSSIRKRRAYKNVVRDGEALVEKSLVAAKQVFGLGDHISMPNEIIGPREFRSKPPVAFCD